MLGHIFRGGSVKKNILRFKVSGRFFCRCLIKEFVVSLGKFLDVMT